MSRIRARTHTSAESPGAGRRVPGVYMGIVTDNDDPRKMGRIKVRVTEVGGQKILAWAKPPVPVGGDKAGFFGTLQVNSQVLVVFEAEDQNRPVILGAWYPQVSEESTAPVVTRGKDDPIRDARGNDTGTGAGGASLEEPADPFGAEYPFNFVFKSPGAGHLIEIDDTEGKERISITHGPSKSWLEFHPDGTIVIGSKAKRYLLVETDNQEHIKGNQDVLVDGNSTHKTSGTRDEEYGGARDVKDKADYTQTVDGKSTRTVQGSVSDTVQGNVNLTFNAQLAAVIQAAVQIQLAAAMTLQGTSMDIQGSDMKMTMATVDITSPQITLGSAAALKLIDERIVAFHNANIALYNAHSHPAMGANPPTVPQIPIILPGVSTQLTKAS